ncbi:MmyB family transcriptional regulator [Kribbella sp. CWNU-51]
MTCPRDGDFRRWWTDQDVFKPRHGSKTYRHPAVGDLILGYEQRSIVGQHRLVLLAQSQRPADDFVNCPWRT